MGSPRLTVVTDEASEPAKRIVEVTGRVNLRDAIAWLAEDHPMTAQTDWASLMRNIVAVGGSGQTMERALRRVVREATTSDVDTARVLFDVGSLPQSRDIKNAVDELLSRSVDGTFSGLTPRGVLRSLHANPLSVDALCYSAGISPSEAAEWFKSGSNWGETELEELLNYLRLLLAGDVASPLPNAEPARGIEYVTSGLGWELADLYWTQGVPYEVFLAQRAVGGAWLAHKNRTSSFPNIAAADALCTLLEERKVDFRRSSIIGGAVRQLDLQDLSGIADRRVGLVAVSEGVARYAVGFSAARDGGTARANGDGLLQIPTTGLPFAFVLTGPGWSGRPETDRLARKFTGRLFTDRTLMQLVHDIETLIS